MKPPKPRSAISRKLKLLIPTCIYKLSLSRSNDKAAQKKEQSKPLFGKYKEAPHYRRGYKRDM